MEGMPAEGTGLPIVGEEIAGKYRIESILGQGGMGAVYAARNVMTGKRVAIKWLLPEHAASNTRERLLREAQCAASIDHPNVVDIYDVGEHQGGLFLVMEYLRGKPLSEVLAERGRLDPDELITMLVPAMRGVHAAHQAGVIHRDLKPENILLSESDGQIVPKVVDFGVSKNVNAATSLPNSSLTRTGALVGTPHYMALEQVDGSNVIDSRTDVYAFGVLLYRALTGHFPFDGSSLGEVILKIGTKEPSPMRLLRPELPPGLDTLVLRALSRDRTKRFNDLEELARGLTQFGSRTGESTDSSVTPGAIHFRPFGGSGVDTSTGARAVSSARATAPHGPPVRRRRTLYIAGAAALVLLLSGAWMARRESTTVATALPAQPHPGAKSAELTRPAGTAAEPTGTLPALGPMAQQPSAAQPDAILDGKDEPPDAAEAAVTNDEQAVQAPSAPRPTASDSRSDKVSRSDKARAASERSKARSTSAGRKSNNNGSSLVPGERTNGFSVDEF